MKCIQSIFLFIIFSFCIGEKAMAFSPKLLMGQNDKYTVEKMAANKAELKNTISQKTEKAIEVESQPWGIGLAIIFITSSVWVMKIGTPSPTFFIRPNT